jgi:hypothetical protein
VPANRTFVVCMLMFLSMIAPHNTACANRTFVVCMLMFLSMIAPHNTACASVSPFFFLLLSLFVCGLANECIKNGITD